MASPNSPLANVLKKSLNMNWSVSESWNWNTAAKGLRGKYTELLALRKGIKKLVDRDWVDLANRYDALIQKMVALESVKIGTSDGERKTYTKKVAALIGDAETLKRDIENEPNPLKAESDYKERSARVDALLQYATTNGLLKLQPYSNLTQA